MLIFLSLNSVKRAVPIGERRWLNACQSKGWFNDPNNKKDEPDWSHPHDIYVSFGFANSPSAFYLMGYSAIPWYVFSALLFFIPFALMMAEMGSAYRKEEGGIYSWMNNSVGPRYAFIGTFMWFSSYVIWMVSTAAKVWVPFSTFLFGADMTQHWRIVGLEPTQVVGLLAVGWMILVTCVASRGINKIARITAVGGIAVMCLNLVLLLVSVAILLLTGGHFAQDINFISSPNPGYQSGLAMLSFVVFAIFAYGGIEAVGGLVDKTEKPERTLQRHCLCRYRHFSWLFAGYIFVGC